MLLENQVVSWPKKFLMASTSLYKSPFTIKKSVKFHLSQEEILQLKSCQSLMIHLCHIAVRSNCGC